MKKGFTLIELLAVIVILAIIALIATPIIINIIDNTKKSANQRSAELYMDAVTQKIASMNMQEEFNPSVCNIMINGNIKCDGSEEEIEIKMDGTKPTGGILYLTNGKINKYNLTISNKEVGNFKIYNIKYNLTGVTVTNNQTTLEVGKSIKLTITPNANHKIKEITVTGAEKEVNEAKTELTIKNPTKDVEVTIVAEVPPIGTALGTYTKGQYNIGDKYSVKVNNTLSLDFNILSKNLDSNGNVESVNLLLSQNIKKDGTGYASSENDNVQWYTTQDNSNGPLTAISFLENAVGAANSPNGWTNIPSFKYTYIDDGGNNRYTLVGTASENKMYRARLPKYREMLDVNCTTETGSCPLWAVNYLYGVEGNKTGSVDAPFVTYGYWTSGATYDYTTSAWYVRHYATVHDSGTSDTTYGVRPVITLPVSMLTQS